MFAYLAAPIDQAGPGSEQIFMNEQVGGLLTQLAQLGVSYFSPGSAYGVRSMQTAWAAIDTINTTALDSSDVLIAIVPPGVATLGVPVEIERGLARNTPVVIFTSETLAINSVQIRSWARRGASIWTAQSWTLPESNLLADLQRTPAMALGQPVPVSRETPGEVKGRRFLDATTQQPTLFSELVEIKEPDLPVICQPGARYPTRGHDTDAGLDLAVLEGVTLAPGEYHLVSTGVQAQVPVGYWGMITGRSSAWSIHRLDVRMAVIDAGYTGELMIGVENRSGVEVTLKARTRLAQYVLLPAYGGKIVEVDKFDEHPRGSNGYGSTGTH